MAIDWVHFSPLPALFGGLLIGGAASAFILLHGRIMGVSSILGGLLRPVKSDLAWRLSFFAGLIAAPVCAKLLGLVSVPRIEQSALGLIVAGLLVGFGTSLGSGCTSGHGVCGLARLSPRSILATCIFIAFGMATVWLTHKIQVGP